MDAADAVLQLAPGAQQAAAVVDQQTARVGQLRAPLRSNSVTPSSLFFCTR
jgi:hypothetical protein